MRFPELRAILQRVVLVGLPACIDPVGQPSPPVHHDITIADPSPPVQLLVESCRVDADACPALCESVRSANNFSGAIAVCNVTFDSSAAYVGLDIAPFAATGRMPVGLVPVHRGSDASAGAYLAHCAWLEAASVPAFVFLARELEAHGAPRELIAAALAAANDEIRHAVMVGNLARRYGARPAPAEVAAHESRTLEALALDNVVEGCVRETWGAALALWQSHTAQDPDVRAAFAAIARDELAHAELGWAIDRWARTRLDDDAIAGLDAARAAAARALLDAPPDPALPALGLPDERALRALRARTHAALWDGGVA